MKLSARHSHALIFAVALCLGPSVTVQAQAPAQRAAAAQASKTLSEASVEEKGGAEVDENDAYRHSAIVKKMGKALGMSTETAADVFEWLNFGVLAAGLGFMVIKILPKAFRDRSSAIQKELVDARTATEEAGLRLSSVEDRLSKLDEQIAGMKAQAEKDSAADEARIKASVEEEKKKILQAADQEIAAASVHAQRALQKFAAELAIEQAARKLVVSAETDRLLIQNFARRLTGDDSTGGQN